jgi:hypothetical protein
MGDVAEFGVPELGLPPGDHICALYTGTAERDTILAAYLRHGLLRGDRCIAVVDTDHGTLLDGIDDLDARACIASRQLDLLTSDQAYLRNGGFVGEDMLAFWNEYLVSALDEGPYRFARVAGETAWALREPPVVDELMRYESELNRFASRFPQCVMCFYDLQIFGGGILVDLLKTHPKLLIGGMVIDNPHCLSPDEFIASRL